MGSKSWQIAAVLMILTESVGAGDYTFEIPQLLGHYLGDIPASPTVEVSVNLGMEFARIESASLQLTGTHSAGLVGDLNSEITFQLPAEIIASFDGPNLFSDVFIDKLLPAENGGFELDEQFRVGRLATDPPDFSPWTDGAAEFQFWVTPPLMPAIYYLIEMPSVTITSATLVIQGQPNLDGFMLPGDFDGNGSVDGKDLLTWQRNPTTGVLEDWHNNYGEGMLMAVSIVPEPGSMVVVMLALVAFSKRDLRLTQ